MFCWQIQQSLVRKSRRSRTALLVALFAGSAHFAGAQTVTRAEALKIGESFIEHRWQASAKNVKHGKDGAGVDVQTPDRDGDQCRPSGECWVPDAENVGVAYKWGGNDTPETFTAGVRAGKPAGDVYTDAKRKGGGKTVSGDAVGIDCSGFICRCWKLTTRHSTESLPSICEKLSSPAELKPGDIMNGAGAHVLLFAKWTNPEKTHAVFYEASPFSKTVASERDVNQMTNVGFKPLRYRQIRD
jgi:cell wall-associated NlpC family hydrolase